MHKKWGNSQEVQLDWPCLCKHNAIIKSSNKQYLCTINSNKQCDGIWKDSGSKALLCRQMGKTSIHCRTSNITARKKKKKNYDKGAGSSKFMIKSATTSWCCWGAVSVFGSKKWFKKNSNTVESHRLNRQEFSPHPPTHWSYGASPRSLWIPGMETEWSVSPSTSRESRIHKSSTDIRMSPVRNNKDTIFYHTSRVKQKSLLKSLQLQENLRLSLLIERKGKRQEEKENQRENQPSRSCRVSWWNHGRK